MPDIRNDTCPVYYKKIPGSRIENALEYRINHLKLRFENIINFFPKIGGKNGVFLKSIHLWTKSKKSFFSKL